MRPLLVGESNPYQVNPRLAQHYALYPDPPGCAGWRLCYKVMQLTEEDYLAHFDRVNLCNGKWSMRDQKQTNANHDCVHFQKREYLKAVNELSPS